KHGPGASRPLISRLEARAQYEPGQAPVVAGYAFAAQEILVFQLVNQRENYRTAVCGGSARQAGNAAGHALGRHIIKIAGVYHPIGDNAPHTALTFDRVLACSHTADARIDEWHLYRLEQPIRPGRIRIREDDNLGSGSSDAYTQ